MADRPLSGRGLILLFVADQYGVEHVRVNDEIAALEAEVDDFRTVVAGDRETGRKMWLAYHTAVAIEPIAADRDRLRAALKQIVACDFRGNMPREQAIARAALEEGGDG